MARNDSTPTWDEEFDFEVRQEDTAEDLRQADALENRADNTNIIEYNIQYKYVVYIQYIIYI